MRSKCKNIAYKIIQIRVRENFSNLYLNLKKLIDDIKLAFEQKNELIKINDEFFDFDFKMNNDVKNKNETFDEFLNRF